MAPRHGRSRNPIRSNSNKAQTRRKKKRRKARKRAKKTYGDLRWGVSMTMVGDEEIMENLEILAEEAPEMLAAALWIEANEIINEAIMEVPVDTGVLRASANVGEPVINGQGISLALGFGGAASAYAQVQHDNLSYRHTVGNALYLSGPFDRHMAGPFTSHLSATIVGWLEDE